MAKKKQQSVLGLPPLPPLISSSTSTGLAIVASAHAVTPREMQIYEISHEDKVLMGAYADKGRYGLEAMNETKLFAATDFSHTVQQIEEIRKESEGSSCQPAIDEFSAYLTNLCARHTLGAVEVTAGAIAEVISETVEPPEVELPPEPPKGFLTRLFGG